MLEQVCIVGDDEQLPGVADALIYYGTTDLQVSSNQLAQLCKRLGPGELCSLVDSGDLRLLYSPSFYAVQSISQPVETHRFSRITFTGTREGRRIRNAVDAIEVDLRRTIGHVRAKKVARDLGERIIERSPNIHVERLATDDMEDAEYRNSAVAAVLNDLVPGSVDAANFRVDYVRLGDRFLAPIVLDFAALNEQYHRTISPEHSSISPAFVYARVLSARNHLMLGAERNGDVWLPRGSAALINLRISSLARRLNGKRRDIAYFNEVTFTGRSFGEALRSGQRTPAELVAFVQSEQTRRMKGWAAGLDADANLISEYAKENERRGILESVPARLMKLSIFAGLGASLAPGLVGLAAGLGLAAADEFLVSKMSWGWKPNSWSRDAQKFLGDD